MGRRAPDRRSGDEDGFLIAAHTRGMPRLFLVPSSNGRFSPLVAPKVDEHADQPRFLVCRTDWNGRDRARGLEECVLDEIPRRIGGWNKAPRQAVQPLVMGVEERGQPVGRRVRERDWQDIGEWHPAHMLVNVPEPNYLGVREPMTRVRRRTVTLTAGRSSPSVMRRAARSWLDMLF